jgi:hypothetical protein
MNLRRHLRSFPPRAQDILQQKLNLPFPLAKRHNFLTTGMFGSYCRSQFDFLLSDIMLLPSMLFLPKRECRQLSTLAPRLQKH